jgi:hypothetical protein
MFPALWFVETDLRQDVYFLQGLYASPDTAGHVFRGSVVRTVSFFLPRHERTLLCGARSGNNSAGCKIQRRITNRDYAFT